MEDKTSVTTHHSDGNGAAARAGATAILPNPEPPAAQTRAGLDELPKSLTELALPQNFGEVASVQKMTTTVPVRRAHKHEFFQLNPDPTWQLTTGVLELKPEGETYLVAPELWAEAGDFIVPTTLYAGITLQKVLFLMPVRLPAQDGRSNPWHESLREAAQIAMGRWIAVRANMALGAYEVHVARADLPAPTWPDMSFDAAVRIAFKGRYIAGIDHPVLRRLRGELA